MQKWEDLGGGGVVLVRSSLMIMFLVAIWFPLIILTRDDVLKGVKARVQSKVVKKMASFSRL